MSNQALTKHVSVREVLAFFGSILGPERNYYALALVYGIGISVLSLALPISVQMLVNTVANTGLPTPLLVLSLTLFVLLVASGLFECPANPPDGHVRAPLLCTHGQRNRDPLGIRCIEPVPFRTTTMVRCSVAISTS